MLTGLHQLVVNRVDVVEMGVMPVSRDLVIDAINQEDVVVAHLRAVVPSAKHF